MTSKIYQYQYDGRTTWVEILAWCGQNIPDQFYCNDRDTLRFRDQEAYALFLLRWS